MDITLATFSRPPQDLPPGRVFTRAFVPAKDYAANRNSLLTGQYPQRGATTRITDIFSEAGWQVSEDPAASGFRLLEEPRSVEGIDGVVATAVLSDPCLLTIYWPGVAEDGQCAELVSPMDLAPTLAAIAGLDVRPNATLSFDGMNLVPVLRYGASGHAALFFEDGIQTQDASLRGGVASNESRRAALQEEWKLWHKFMDYGPLQ